jgi:hypothetical protein
MARQHDSLRTDMATSHAFQATPFPWPRFKKALYDSIEWTMVARRRTRVSPDTQQPVMPGARQPVLFDQ